MPELPEVETTRLGITPHLLLQQLQHIHIRQGKLRWPVPADTAKSLEKQYITHVYRRAKYLILICQPLSASQVREKRNLYQTTQTPSCHTQPTSPPHGSAWIIIHLGMSGSLRICTSKTLPEKHDHIDLIFSPQCILRYRDPRRFGCVLCGHGDPWQHQLLKKLGPEPWDRGFNSNYLHTSLSKRTTTIKAAIMQQQLVVGVGNIYACEALFQAGIDPRTPANQLEKKSLANLIKKIKNVLTKAISAGGTTLRDFRQAHGEPGYFQQKLYVYARAGEACRKCQTSICSINIAQRNTFYCPRCQT